MDFRYPSPRDNEELQKLVMRMNPPRVSINNASDDEATLIMVDSVNKRGSLLQVVQVLTDMDLMIRRAYIASDGDWFTDVFHITDECGDKVYNERILGRIEESLAPTGNNLWSEPGFVGVQAASEHTAIELSGRDRPGLLSLLSAVLTDQKCNIVAAEVWTHNSRMASVVYITDEASGMAIDDPGRLDNIKHLLLSVLKDHDEWRNPNTAVSHGSVLHTQRRLHQIMYADRDYEDEDDDDDDGDGSKEKDKPLVSVEHYAEKRYTVVTVNCPNRPKLIFDTVCTITDMQYVIYHAIVSAEGEDAVQEYYIRHMDGNPISSDAEKQRLIHCLEAAINRRASHGIRLELCCDDRIGLLSDATRIFRENGLSVTRAEVTTRGTQAVNTFYVTDASGNAVKSEAIEAVRKEIGETILRVKEETCHDSTSQLKKQRFFSIGGLFRTGSEKLLSNLGLI